MAWFPRVEAVGLVSRTVLLECGIVIPIVEFYDADGDEILPEDYADAVYVVAGTEEFGWLQVTLAEEQDTVH